MSDNSEKENNEIIDDKDTLISEDETDAVSESEQQTASEPDSSDHEESDEELPQKPMSFKDIAEEENLTVPAETEQEEKEPYGSEDDLRLPPFSASKKSGRLYFFKSFLWMLSVVMVSVVIFFIYNVISNTGTKENNNDTNPQIPTNKYEHFSNEEESQLPGAPDASADPDGPQISTASDDSEPEHNIANKAFNKATPSVVCITSYKGGADPVLNKLGTGSGIIISANGYVATNSHVVDDSANTGVMVTTYDGSQYLGTIIGVDPKTDLAVLKIDAKDLVPAEFADSDHLYVGQNVFAIGSPGGTRFSNSLTSGTISALNRLIQSSGYVKYIQTDAAINPGNSGGPLINENGQVIGINTSKIVSTNYEGMGFAIPGNKVAEIVNKLIKYGYINDRGTLSIEGTTCNLYESKSKNVPEGMVITKINKDSPLFSTMVNEQDIIIAVNGVRVKSSYEFIEELSKFGPSDQITLTLFRASDDPRESDYTYDYDVTLIPDAVRKTSSTETT